MEIRLIEKQDIPLLAKALSAAYSQEPFSESWTDDKARIRVEAALCGYRAMGLAAVEDGVIAGAVMGRVDPYDNEDMFFVDELFVIPEKKRQGIGRRLLAELENVLGTMDISAIELISIHYNEPFYEKCGLEKGEVSVLGKNLK